MAELAELAPPAASSPAAVAVAVAVACGLPVTPASSCVPTEDARRLGIRMTHAEIGAKTERFHITPIKGKTRSMQFNIFLVPM